jgi:hypothetical protein
VLWDGRRAVVLSETFGAGAAINDRGEVAGYYVVGEGNSFTWRRGRLTDIPRPAGLPDATLLQSTGINDRGEVVGTDGFRWDGRTVSILPGGTQPADIDDRGRIVGFVGGPDGTRAVLLTPTR